ncbi:hypothetical protein ACVXHB_22565 [Escherichia coli]
MLKKAFWLAASGRPGPVVVDLPKDFLIRRTITHVWRVGQYAFFTIPLLPDIKAN